MVAVVGKLATVRPGTALLLVGKDESKTEFWMSSLVLREYYDVTAFGVDWGSYSLLIQKMRRTLQEKILCRHALRRPVEHFHKAFFRGSQPSGSIQGELRVQRGALHLVNTILG